jgi:hypothetical protein
MYAQTSTSSITPARSVIRNYFTAGGWPFQLRHPEGWVAVHAVALVWLLILASLLCSLGYAWGALVYLAAVKELVFGYRLLKTSRSLRH